MSENWVNLALFWLQKIWPNFTPPLNKIHNRKYVVMDIKQQFCYKIIVIIEVPGLLDQLNLFEFVMEPEKIEHSHLYDNLILANYLTLYKRNTKIVF